MLVTAGAQLPVNERSAATLGNLSRECNWQLTVSSEGAQFSFSSLLNGPPAHLYGTGYWNHEMPAPRPSFTLSRTRAFRIVCCHAGKNDFGSPQQARRCPGVDVAAIVILRIHGPAQGQGEVGDHRCGGKTTGRGDRSHPFERAAWAGQDHAGEHHSQGDGRESEEHERADD